MEYQIQRYDLFRESMKELQTLCNWIPDTSTQEGYDKSKRLGLDGRKVFNAIEKARISEKEDILEKGRLIDSEAKSIQNDITEAIQPHIDAYREVDNREKVRKAELEEMIDGRIEAFRNCVELGADMDADELTEMIDDIKADPLEDCYHRTAEALKVRNAVVKRLENTLRQILVEEERRKAEKVLAVQRETEAKLAAEKLEEERKVFEAEKAQAAKERDDREKLAVEERRKQAAQQKILDDQEAEFDRKRVAQEREEFQRQEAVRAKEAAEREAEVLKKVAADREQREAKEAARIEAQQPDLEKLRRYSANLVGVTVPTIVDKDVSAQLSKVFRKLEEISVLCDNPVNFHHE